ncbi:hypothetical protein [Streptomyces acidicola]|uniref:hypothetical protein n=1 Tax=Streptomyces acidicola TaxID=2596892 RepID=UPI003814A208
MAGAAAAAPADSWGTSQLVSATPQGDNYGTVAPLDDWSTVTPQGDNWGAAAPLDSHVTITPQGDSYGTVIPLGSVWGVA